MLIKERLSKTVLHFTDTNFNVPEDNKKIISYTRKSLNIITNQITLIKRHNSLLDATMGEDDGTEVFVLVHSILLYLLPQKYKKKEDQYRDSSFIVFKRYHLTTTTENFQKLF